MSGATLRSADVVRKGAKIRTVAVTITAIQLAHKRPRAYIGDGGLRLAAGETYPRGLIDLEGSCP